MGKQKHWRVAWSWLAVLAVAALIATVVSLSGTCETPATQQLGATASPSPTPAATGEAAARATPSPSPRPSASAATKMRGVEAFVAGKWIGDVVFASRQTGEGVGSIELWMIPLDIRTGLGQPRIVLRYARTLIDNAFVSRQLSPDGRRYVFPADRGDGTFRLAIVDLETGSASFVTTDNSAFHEVYPSWSPDGTKIAFSRWSTSTTPGAKDDGAWAVNVDGTGLRRLTAGNTIGNGPTYVWNWSWDGRRVGIDQSSGYTIIDVTTGARSAATNIVSGTESWRAKSPHAVGEAWDGNNTPLIVTADDLAGPRTEILRGAAAGSRPRWSPTRDEFLMRRRINDPAIEGGGKLVIAVVGSDGAGSRDVTPNRMFAAEWTPDGNSIAYIAERLEQQGRFTAVVTAELRVVDRDGSGDRELFTWPNPQPGTFPPNWDPDFAPRSFR